MATRAVPEVVDHLFRREAGKMVSYFTRVFGMNRLSLAEDVVQEALCQALQTWSIRGLPDNPPAWLMRVARNRAIDLARRDKKFRDFTPELTHLMKLREESRQADPVFEKEIQDDQLRMMFSCCHPGLSTEVQVTLILKTLCGFSVGEIASAFLANEDSIEKRLGRARKLFRDSGKFVEFAGEAEFPERLEAVYQAIYLLFNEGYHASESEQTIREDLCYEALRLGLLLSEHPMAARPKTFALLALCCFNAARLAGRVEGHGELIQLEHQDRSKWDAGLIAKGFGYLEKSAAEQEMSEFHVEAAIASLHSGAESFEKTNWEEIVKLYDLLYLLKSTPIVGLNRAVAVGYAEGAERGLEELARIAEGDKLEGYPFYPAAMGEFYLLAGRRSEAEKSFARAEGLARNPAERRFLEGKRKECFLEYGK